MADGEGEKPAPSSGIDTAKLVAGGFAVVSGSVTLIGGFTGAVPRLLRNESAMFLLAIGFALLAIGIALVGSMVSNRNSPPLPREPKPGETGTEVTDRIESDKAAYEQWKVDVNYGREGDLDWLLKSFNTKGVYIGISFIVFVAASIFTIFGLRGSLIEIDQPQISFTWKETEEGVRPIANVKVKIDGVQTEDTLIVTVHPGIRLQPDVTVAESTVPVTVTVSSSEVLTNSVQSSVLPDGLSYDFDTGIISNTILYHASVGANLDGVAEMDFEVQVPENYGALQIVAGLNQVRDCNGELERVSDTVTTIPPESPPPDPNSISCVVVRAPIDGVVPAATMPSVSVPAVTTVTTTAPAPNATVVLTFAGTG